eukprot:CAMPEP_0194288242 /NCGR_PEP_ID=MMETSP0169-20130528/36423_1 /TAXON_ID=218684 /ORGANISM="Corethron pennatum, Strain L29A3" /LENGTH=413 /DNA_ID=CAMNT_0039035191 /DNA_START=76 /DNA_END=1314 /DNA_ORIENTATION=-
MARSVVLILFNLLLLYITIDPCVSFKIIRQPAAISFRVRLAAAPSLGSMVQDAPLSLPALLDLCGPKFLVLPRDPGAPKHLTQTIHVERAARLSGLLIEKIGLAAAASPHNLGGGPCPWHDPRFARTVGAARGGSASDICRSISSLHVLAGRRPPRGNVPLPSKIIDGIVDLVDAAEEIASSDNEIGARFVLEARWACRGLSRRLDIQVKDFPHLDALSSPYPFDIVPCAVDTSPLVLPELLEEVPFRSDVLTTRTGKKAAERRRTAWLAADSGVGSLAYSGKLMTPSPMAKKVREISHAAERVLSETGATTSASGLGPPFFDCVLCNHYPDGGAACRFHTDPEHGTVWHGCTAVVAFGDDRRFAFRPTPGRSWDGDVELNNRACEPAVAHMFAGDLVVMWGECNNSYEHAVY